MSPSEQWYVNSKVEWAVQRSGRALMYNRFLWSSVTPHPSSKCINSSKRYSLGRLCALTHNTMLLA